MAVGDSSLELGGSLLVLAGGVFEIVLGHVSGSSFGHGMGVGSGKRA